MPRPGELVQVAGPIWLLAAEGGGRFPRSHSVLVQDPQACALVDTGCGIQLLAALRDRLRVDLVLNTHAHPDHAAGNHLFADLPIRVPEQAAATAGNLLALSERFFDAAVLRPRWRAWVQREMGFVDQPPSGSFVAGEELDIGRTRLAVIPTPGHTVDHSCLYCAEHGVLIAADIDLTPFGPWYGHPESSLAELRASIDRVRALRPRTVVSAHRPPVTGEHAVQRALDRFAGVLGERERRLLALLGRPRPLAQIVDAAPIYGRFAYAPELMRYWEEQMVRKHLAELVERGAVEPGAGGFVARG